MKQTKSTELWAVLDKDGNIMWTRGGSSTKSRLMVYDNPTTAKRALASNWTRQVIPDPSDVRIERVYKKP